MVEKQKIMEIASLVYDIIQESGGQYGKPYVNFTASNVSYNIWSNIEGFKHGSGFDFSQFITDQNVDDIIGYLKELLEYAKERRKQCTSDLARNQENE